MQTSYFISTLCDAYEKFISFGMTSHHAYIKACGYVDYVYQLPMVGFSSTDTLMADQGLEGRTPFARKEVIRLALNSPVKHLLSSTSLKVYQTKAPLSKIFTDIYKRPPLPKSGFAGYPNETIKYLDDPKDWRVFDYFPESSTYLGTNRDLDWKLINTEWFLRTWNL